MGVRVDPERRNRKKSLGLRGTVSLKTQVTLNQATWTLHFGTSAKNALAMVTLGESAVTKTRRTFGNTQSLPATVT